MVKMHDTVKGDDYYRPIGGCVEFGETTTAALLREFREELNTGIMIDGEPLILENIFTCDGEMGHEIVYLYPARFENPVYYNRQVFILHEASGETFDALWVNIVECLSGNLRLVPEELLHWYTNRR